MMFCNANLYFTLTRKTRKHKTIYTTSCDSVVDKQMDMQV